MAIDLNTLRVGDTIVFADGTKGVCSVVYQNGPGYFIRWDVFGDDGKKKAWSGTDDYCCRTCMPRSGRHDEGMNDGCIWERPKDIVDIIKPPLEELQDEIARLRKELTTKG